MTQHCKLCWFVVLRTIYARNICLHDHKYRNTHHLTNVIDNCPYANHFKYDRSISVCYLSNSYGCRVAYLEFYPDSPHVGSPSLHD